MVIYPLLQHFSKCNEILVYMSRGIGRIQDLIRNTNSWAQGQISKIRNCCGETQQSVLQDACQMIPTQASSVRNTTPVTQFAITGRGYKF